MDYSSRNNITSLPGTNRSTPFNEVNKIANRYNVAFEINSNNVKMKKLFETLVVYAKSVSREDKLNIISAYGDEQTIDIYHGDLDAAYALTLLSNLQPAELEAIASSIKVKQKELGQNIRNDLKHRRISKDLQAKKDTFKGSGLGISKFKDFKVYAKYNLGGFESLTDKKVVKNILKDLAPVLNGFSAMDLLNSATLLDIEIPDDTTSKSDIQRAIVNKLGMFITVVLGKSKSMPALLRSISGDRGEYKRLLSFTRYGYLMGVSGMSEKEAAYYRELGKTTQAEQKIVARNLNIRSKMERSAARKFEKQFAREKSSRWSKSLTKPPIAYTRFGRKKWKEEVVPILASLLDTTAVRIEEFFESYNRNDISDFEGPNAYLSGMSESQLMDLATELKVKYSPRSTNTTKKRIYEAIAIRELAAQRTGKKTFSDRFKQLFLGREKTEKIIQLRQKRAAEYQKSFRGKLTGLTEKSLEGAKIAVSSIKIPGTGKYSLYDFQATPVLIVGDTRDQNMPSAETQSTTIADSSTIVSSITKTKRRIIKDSSEYSISDTTINKIGIGRLRGVSERGKIRALNSSGINKISQLATPFVVPVLDIQNSKESIDRIYNWLDGTGLASKLAYLQSFGTSTNLAQTGLAVSSVKKVISDASRLSKYMSPPKLATGGSGKSSGKITNFISGDSLTSRPNPERVSIDWGRKSFSVKPIPSVKAETIPKFATGVSSNPTNLKRMTSIERSSPMAVALTTAMAKYNTQIDAESSDQLALKVFNVNSELDRKFSYNGKEVSLIDLLGDITILISSLTQIANSIASSSAITASNTTNISSSQKSNSRGSSGTFTSELDSILQGA